jgi:hypothetical protein
VKLAAYPGQRRVGWLLDIRAPGAGLRCGASLYLAVAAARPLSTLRLGTQGGEVRPAGLGMLIEVAATRRPRAQRSPMARDRPYRLPAEEPAFCAVRVTRLALCFGDA